MLLIVAVGVCAAFQIGKVPPALTELQSSLGISLVVGGWVISTYSAVGSVCGIAMGAVGDRFGYRRTLLFGVSCIGAGSLLGSAAPGPGWLLASRALEGLGFILVVVSAPSLIFQIVRPSDLGIAFGLWSCFMPVGTSAMMLASPALLSLFGWRGVWACNGLLLLSAGAAFHYATRGLPGRGALRAAAPGRLWSNVRAVVSCPGPVLLAVSWSMYTTTYMVLMGFLPTLLMADGHTRAAAAALTAAAVAVNAAGALGGGWLLKHGAPRWGLMAFSGAVSGLCMVAIYSPGTAPWLRYGLCVLFSAVGGLQPAAVLGGAPHYAPTPTAVATTNGFINQCSYVGMVLGPPAAAALASASGGWHNTPWILSSGAAIWISSALLLRRVGPGTDATPRR
ncbi:MAG: CynX/NimT family MFS transporter [Deferrisomatales bacterium]